VAGEARRRRLRELLALAGAALDPAAVASAFVHESALREGLADVSNERLEFYGDAILGAVVARSLFERYPGAHEGELTLRKHALVADVALAATAERLEFDALLVLGAGLARETPARRRSALADAFEAFVAALAIAAGPDVAAGFVVREHVLPHEALGEPLADPKTILQEWTQRRFGRVPEYVDRFEGPDHDRVFTADVLVPDGSVATGSGPQKRAAQRAAAAAALLVLGATHDDLMPPALTRAAVVPKPKRSPASRGSRAKRNKAAG